MSRKWIIGATAQQQKTHIRPDYLVYLVRFFVILLVWIVLVEQRPPVPSKLVVVHVVQILKFNSADQFQCIYHIV